MNTTGAQPPRRAGLARIVEATNRASTALHEHRSWARDRRDALGYFHDELSLRPGASVRDVLDAIAERRGRRIKTHVLSSLPPTVSGMAVLGTEDEDHIGTSSRLSPWHRALVSLHEGCHFRDPSFNSESWADVGCSIAVHSHVEGVTLQSLREQIQASGLPERVQEEILTRPVRLRASYGEDEERRCEVFARVVLPLLDLDPTSRSTGLLSVTFGNRRAIR
ncbi:hypothetical protein ACFYWN_45170 [Streptomyces sp. NPDC002917]|uniref:hypothetical protein n=1 Tax=Streptomyces sp. NPDC002917 TaxID=3364671 RepID=UPI0036AC4E11